MSVITNLFTPDYERYEGVRPINIYLLRLNYFLMAAFVFTIFYKSIWLIVVAYPLWRANALWGSPAEPMTKAFLWLPLAIIAVPWGYVLQNYVMWSKTKSVEQNRAPAA